MIVAAVPVKRLDRAKSRLSGVLIPADRAGLAVALVRRTLAVLEDVTAVERIAIVTEEQDLATRLGSEWLPDRGDLNRSLAAAVEWSIQNRATGLLILPGDLPLVRPEDIEALIRGDAQEMRIAATRDGGTGALLLRPPDSVPIAFGPGSFRRHVELARVRGIDVRQVRRQGLTRDLDTEADLRAFASSLAQIGWYTPGLPAPASGSA